MSKNIEQDTDDDVGVLFDEIARILDGQPQDTVAAALTLHIANAARLSGDPRRFLAIVNDIVPMAMDGIAAQEADSDEIH